MCGLPEHPPSWEGSCRILLSSNANALTHVQYFWSENPIWELDYFRILLEAGHCLEADQNSSVLEKKGKQVFTMSHVVCTYSLSRLAQKIHPYHVGNISKSSFSNASQWPTLQASLYKENSLGPAMLTLSCIGHISRYA